MNKSTYVDDHLVSQLHEAAAQLLNHGVVAFPTETVMGVGVVYDDEFAYNRLNNIKRRPESKPYALMVEDPDQIGFFAEVNDNTKKIIKAFLPGPLTVLLPAKKNVPHWVTRGTGVIGIRCPDDPITEHLLKFTGKPLLAPSANRSGETPAKNSDEVKRIFDDELDYIVEGEALGGVPSTIIDLTGSEIKLVREGPITLEMINHVLGDDYEKVAVAIGSDHAAFDAKRKVSEYLNKKGYDVIDCGTFTPESCDYPEYGAKVGKMVASKDAKFGVVLCGSGIGISIAANKVKGVRCGIAYNDDVAVLMRQHNNANVIAFGARFMEIEDICRRLDLFLNTPFESGGRHEKRVAMIKSLER